MAVDLEPVVAAYRASGYAVVRGAVDSGALAGIEQHLDSLPVSATGIAACSIELDATARAIASDGPLESLAAAVLDGPVVPFGVSYLVKAPRSPLPVLWHQDGHPWREQLGIELAVTAWVALDPSTVASGCLWVVPGSHHVGSRRLRRRDEPRNVFGWASPPGIVDESSAVPVELQPGDVSLHHHALVHRSGPNETDRRRAALAVRYCRSA
jgi:phytanoyl-CoA hydroxylase